MYLNTLKPSGHYTYRQVYHSPILRSAHTVYLCVFCGSQNKQRFYVFSVDLRTNSDYFPIQHLLTGLYNRHGVCLLRGKD